MTPQELQRRAAERQAQIRQAAAARAETAAWFEDAKELARGFCTSHSTFQGGEICKACRTAGLREPPGKNHNLWVTLVGILEKDGIIRKGPYAAPNTRHSHIAYLRTWHSNVNQHPPE